MLERAIWLILDYFISVGNWSSTVRSRAVTVSMFIGYTALAVALVWAIHNR